MTSSGKRVLVCGFITAMIVAWATAELTARHFTTCEEEISWFGDTRTVCEPGWGLGWAAAIAVFLVVNIFSLQLSLVWSIADRLKPANIDDDKMTSPRHRPWC